MDGPWCQMGNEKSGNLLAIPAAFVRLRVGAQRAGPPAADQTLTALAFSCLKNNPLNWNKWVVLCSEQVKEKLFIKTLHWKWMCRSVFSSLSTLKAHFCQHKEFHITNAKSGTFPPQFLFNCDYVNVQYFSRSNPSGVLVPSAATQARSAELHTHTHTQPASSTGVMQVLLCVVFAASRPLRSDYATVWHHMVHYFQCWDDKRHV